jgi:hypothetical protein
MADHARVCWLTTNEPWHEETTLIHGVCLPLNLDQNTAGEFRAQLATLRAAHRARARELPIL